MGALSWEERNVLHFIACVNLLLGERAYRARPLTGVKMKNGDVLFIASERSERTHHRGNSNRDFAIFIYYASERS